MYKFEVGLFTPKWYLFLRQVRRKYIHQIVSTMRVLYKMLICVLLLTSMHAQAHNSKGFVAGAIPSKWVHQNESNASNSMLFDTVCLNYLYQNSFETTNGQWHPGGTNSSWAWGIVSKPIIHSAYEGTKVWVTSVRGNYANSESSYLESPCFDFTAAEYPVFSFAYWVNSENGIDGFRLDYSIDNGTSWNPVTANVNHHQNWCTGTTVSALGTDGWTGSTATGYQLAKTLLPSVVAGKNHVKFRFVFASNNNNSMEGVAIDNIRIYELPYNVGVLSLTSPLSGCLIGGGVNPVKLTGSIKNFGYRPLKAGLKVPYEIKLRNENVVKDTLVIGSIVNQNGSANFTTTNYYSIIAKGFHALRLNTNFSQELDRTNDTLKTTINVYGIPGYSIGPDIAVPNPFPASIYVELDAGLNGLVPYNNYLWSTTETTRKIGATSYGTYAVTVINENGCAATDAINVIESTNDVQVIAAAGLNNACAYPTPVHPQITIKNNGPSGVGPSFSMKNIPLKLMVDGVWAFSETFTPSTDIPSGGTAIYTFTNTINLSTPKTYNISICTTLNEDWNKNNDTLKISTQVWGAPKINFPQDTIASLHATSLVLDAGPGFESYTWKNSAVTTQTFNVPSLHSAWYVATVSAFNGCGTDKDSVYINAKDLSVIDIESPSNTICNNAFPKVAVRIKNVGNDDFAPGSIIAVSYITPSESVSQNFTLNDTLKTDSTLLLTLNNDINLPIGDGFISVFAKIADDPHPANDIYEKSVVTFQSPSINLGADKFVHALSDTLKAANNFSTYDWTHNGSSIGSDSILVATESGIYAIAVTDNNGCAAFDTIVLHLLVDDISMDTLESPNSGCGLGATEAVKVSVKNGGTEMIPNGKQIEIGFIQEGITKTENIILTSDLQAGLTRSFDLINTMDFTIKRSYPIKVWVKMADDLITANDTLSLTIDAYPPVVFSFGPDIVSATPYTLDAGAGFSSYLWSNGATSSSIVVDTTGNYWVELTNSDGCIGSDTVHVTIDSTFVNVDPIQGTKLNVVLSPNPVKEALTIIIQSSTSESFTINFIDPQGYMRKNIKTESCTYFNEKFDMQHYIPGIYLIRISNGKVFRTFKIVVVE